jgi:hypothetical protein
VIDRPRAYIELGATHPWRRLVVRQAGHGVRDVGVLRWAERERAQALVVRPGVRALEAKCAGSVVIEVTIQITVQIQIKRGRGRSCGVVEMIVDGPHRLVEVVRHRDEPRRGLWSRQCGNAISNLSRYGQWNRGWNDGWTRSRGRSSRSGSTTSQSSRRQDCSSTLCRWFRAPHALGLGGFGGSRQLIHREQAC